MSGSITQSQLKAKLEARKAAETDPEKAAAIDVNRALTTSDLSISDCVATIEVVLPKDWSDTFKKRAELKRVSKALADATESTDGGSSGGGNSGGTTPSGGGDTPSGGGDTPSGGGSDTGGDTPSGEGGNGED